MTESRSPTLAEAIADSIEHRLSGLRVSMPGRVESYDTATQRANVKPCVKNRLITDEMMDLPVVQDVPVGEP